MPQILITGANGFIGRQLSSYLSRNGNPVRGTSRHEHPRSSDMEWALVPDPLDPRAIRRALDGITTVFHLGARVHVMRENRNSMEEFRRDNVEASRVLLEEAARAEVTRFVFASTVKVMGESSSSPFTEEMTPRPTDPYGTSKLEAEILVEEVCDRERMQWCILRFPLVYGPGMRANMLNLFRAVDRGVPFPFKGIPNTRSVLFTGNAVRALALVGQSRAAVAETFFVSDGEDTSTEQLVRLIARGLGKSPRLFAVPPSVLRAMGRIGDLISRAAPSPLTSAAIERLLGTLTIDSAKLSRMTGFKPPFSLEEGITQTAAWFVGSRS